VNYYTFHIYKFIIIIIIIIIISDMQLESEYLEIGHVYFLLLLRYNRARLTLMIRLKPEF